MVGWYLGQKRRLTFALFNFVTTEVFLGLGVKCVLTSDGVVLLKTDLLSRVLCVLGGVVRTVSSEFTD